MIPCSAMALNPWRHCSRKAVFEAPGIQGPIYICGIHARLYRRQGWKGIKRMQKP